LSAVEPNYQNQSMSSSVCQGGHSASESTLAISDGLVRPALSVIVSVLKLVLRMDVSCLLVLHIPTFPVWD
jgi:hypothetical protein